MTMKPFMPPAATRLAGLRAYEPPPRDERIDLSLDFNEGPAPGWVPSIDVESMRVYPDAGGLEARIAERWGIDASRVVVTNGGDEAIDRVCRAVLERGSTAVLTDPTFSMIERSIRLAGGLARAIEWVDGDFPAEAVEALVEGTLRLVALVSPNNPTGGTISLRDVRRIAKRSLAIGAAVMLDLAYVEFADEDPTAALLDLPNVVVIRTFSKAHGLAGMRVGYAMTSPAMADLLRITGGPFPCSAASLAAASNSSVDRRSLETIRSERSRLSSLLTDLGAKPLRSQANFVTARFDDPAGVCADLADAGIAVRAFPADHRLAEFLRITLPGNDAAFERVSAALSASLRRTSIERMSR